MFPLFHRAERALKCEFPIDVLLKSLSSSSFSILSLFFLSHVAEWINVWRRVFFLGRGGGRKREAGTSGGGGRVKEVGEGRLVVAACLSARFTVAGYLLVSVFAPW